MIQQANNTDSFYFLRQPEIPDIRQTLSIVNVSEDSPHDMIHICFALHDATGGYSKFTGTAMLSIFDNIDTPPHLPSITVHILHDNTLTQDNRNKFSCLADRYNQSVKFYNVEENFKDKISEIENNLSDFFKEHFGIAAIYRILIPQILSTDIDKVIYLDSDVVVNLDITVLYHI